MTIGEIVLNIISSGVLLIIPIVIVFAQGPKIIEWFVDRIDEWKDTFDWLSGRKEDK